MTQPAGRLFAATLAAVFAGGGTGCTSWKETRTQTARFVHGTYDDPRAEEKLAEGKRLYDAGEYAAARSILKDVADNKNNALATCEEARFVQAECRRMEKSYPEAVDTYNKLLVDHPTGAHRQAACARMFEVADYWLDDFRNEIEARKGEHGVLTKSLSWPNVADKTKPTFAAEDRALEALDHVHTHDVVGPTADQALFWCGYVNYVRGNFQEADHYFSQLAELHKDSPYRPQAVALAIQAKNNSTGGAVYDNRKCAEALQLIHQAKATIPEMNQNPEMAQALTKAELAVRAQQAEKDFKTAEYYERTHHPGSAYFYYELVRRRYSGTRYSDMATVRMEHLKGELEAKKQADKGPSAWGKLTGMFDKGQPTTDVPDDAIPAKKSPADGPSPLPAPRPFPGDAGN